jgi:hypothetical protein
VNNAVNGGGSPGICTLRLVGILCRRLDWDGEVREREESPWQERAIVF